MSNDDEIHEGIRTKQWQSNTRAVYSASFMSSGHEGSPRTVLSAPCHTQWLALFIKVRLKSLDVREKCNNASGARLDAICVRIVKLDLHMYAADNPASAARNAAEKRTDLQDDLHREVGKFSSPSKVLHNLGLPSAWW